MILRRAALKHSPAEPHRLVLESISGAGNLLRRISKFLGDLARELADENAYARHLSWHRREHSRAEWKAFLDARLRNKYQQGKCC